MKVTDVMIPAKNFIFVHPEDTVQKVCGLIITKHVGSVLVYDEQRKDYIGLVTKTDIVNATWTGKLKHDEGKSLVKDIMNVGLISVQSTDDVHLIIERMTNQKVHHVLVKDQEKAIIGMVTALDIAKALIKEKGEDKSSFFSLLGIHK